MTQWYYGHAGEAHGPLTTPEILRLVFMRVLRPSDRLWPAGVAAEQARPAEELVDFATVSWKTAMPPDWLRVYDPTSATPATMPISTPSWLEDVRSLEAPRAELPLRNASTPSEVFEEMKVSELLPQTRRERAPPEPPTSPAPAALPLEKTPAEPSEPTGYDAATGGVVDPAQFQRWKSAQRQGRAEAPQTSEPLERLVYRAKHELEQWLDDPAQQNLLLTSDPAIVLQHEGIQEILRRYGSNALLEEKLKRHVLFVMDNRRQYHEALRSSKK